MPFKPLLALIKKELLENSRHSWINGPLTALLVVLLVGVNARDAAATLPPTQAAQVYGLLAVYIPLIAMPFYASAVLSNAIQAERTRGGMLPLLIFGSNPAIVWLGKLLGAFILAYIVMLLGVAAYAGYTYLYLEQTIFLNGTGLFNLLITMPVAALVIIAFQAFTYWVFRSSTLLAVLIPIAIMFGGAEILSRIEVANPTFLTALVFILLSLGVIGFLAAIVARFPKSRVAGL